MCLLDSLLIKQEVGMSSGFIEPLSLQILLLVYPFSYIGPCSMHVLIPLHPGFNSFHVVNGHLEFLDLLSMHLLHFPIFLFPSVFFDLALSNLLFKAVESQSFFFLLDFYKLFKRCAENLKTGLSCFEMSLTWMFLPREKVTHDSTLITHDRVPTILFLRLLSMSHFKFHLFQRLWVQSPIFFDILLDLLLLFHHLSHLILSRTHPIHSLLNPLGHIYLHLSLVPFKQLSILAQLSDLLPDHSLQALCLLSLQSLLLLPSPPPFLHLLKLGPAHLGLVSEQPSVVPFEIKLLLMSKSFLA